VNAEQRSTRRPGLWSDYYAPEFVVRVDGQRLDPATKGDILQIGVTLDEAQPAAFNLTVSDWDDVGHTFKYSSTTTFDPDRSVTIDLGYADRLVRVVTGVITSLSPKFPESGAPTLTVGGQDLMRKMANSQPGAGQRKLYRNKTDGEIAEEIAARWDMRAKVTTAGPVHPLVAQKNQDDATFLMERAKRVDCEFFISLEEGTGEQVLNFVEREDGRDARPLRVYQFEWGRNLISFSPRLSTTGQVSQVTVRGWDSRAKKAIVYTARASDLPSSAAGDRSGPARADRRASEVIVDAPVLSLEEARRLAISRLMERAHRFTAGTAQIIGLPDLRPNDTVAISGCGPRFSGQYHVTKVTHTLGASGFTTSFEVDNNVEGPKDKRGRGGGSSPARRSP
jgi:Bacteriophage probable baseplate hub protein